MAVVSASTALGLRGTLAVAAMPAVIIFLSSNFVNVGNLLFNMVFSRLMGPELFGVLALLLTIKLVLLGITGAIQMAVSQMVASCARDERPFVEQALSSINRLIFLGAFILGTILTTSILLGEAVGVRLSPTEPHLLLLLLVSLPFGTSLSVLRGVAFGDMKTGRIILSANMEMGVRLVGAILAWKLGFGIEGVVAAISLSIIVAWAVLYDLLPVPTSVGKGMSYSKTLGLAVIPFAILQVTQAIALDGDIFIARALFSEVEGGYVAALSLVQRIQFFACFALASVLLPRVIEAAKNDQNVLDAARPVFVLFAAVSIAVMAAAFLMPELFITLLMGADYLPAASGLSSAVIAAMLFTFNYLIATLLIAIRDKFGIGLIAIGVCVQLAVMAACKPGGFLDLIAIKAICQFTISSCLALYAFNRLRHAQP